MENKRIQNKIFCLIFLLAAFALTVAAIVSGSFLRDRYDIHVDSVSPKRFIAPKEVENTVVTARLRDEAAAGVADLYVHDPYVKEQAITKLDDFFEEIDSLRRDNTPIITPFDDNTDVTLETYSSLSIEMKDSQYKYLIDVGTEQYIELKKNIYETVNSVLEMGIKEESMAKSLLSVKDDLSARNLSHDESSVAYEIISSILVKPNLVIDETSTQRAREEAAEAVEPVVFYKGQYIIDKDEVITEEIYAVLDSLGYTEKNFQDSIIPIVGATIIVAAIFVIMALFIFYFNNGLSAAKKEIMLLFTIYTVCIIAARLMVNLPYQFIPIALFSMLTAILLDSRLAIALNICLSVICAMIASASAQFIAYFAITGIFASILAKYTSRRNKTLLVGIYVSLMCFAVMFALGALFDKSLSNDLLSDSLFAALDGLLTVMLCIGSLPVWEGLFGIVTPIKLLDYADPSNNLLRRLTIESPGTYHHSLIVANLAETAAFDIGANPTLARIGAYYHDIGKLKHPQNFSENQASDNIHDYLDPFESVKLITEHVSTGIELARENKLPDAICDIVEQHHGNTVMKYFYYKAVKLYPENEIAEIDFRYKCPTPKSREAAVVMLADTVEAAVRSMVTSDLDEIMDFIKTLIKDKLNDGQLADSMLTIKDLDVIANSFMRVFNGMYHERVIYPKAVMMEVHE